MGKLLKTYLRGQCVYSCAACRTHLTTHDDIVSKAFQGRTGRAYLFSRVTNVSTGRPEDRVLMSGVHTVCDVYCNQCGATCGWFYLDAQDSAQAFKIGKYVLEKALIVAEDDPFNRDGTS
jgi:hypothetical protein